MNTLPTPPSAVLARRVRELVDLFRDIERSRMAGVPVLHPGLHVDAAGFELEFEPVAEAAATGDDAQAIGILITPWFMNLVVFPLARRDDTAGVGRSQARAVGCENFDFIGAHEPSFGSYAACSLFSPMFEFADHAAASATAQAVLATLRAPVAGVDRAKSPARRSFLLGRSSAAGAAP
ncbi:[NiFe]-hydrogenase assembly chaperone HybE [Methylibium sp.]|uniref:[NiFe]-hydrogenase assembly chaperone HybE n=1 Tax=Methylibium sp. TaxID=2067992 RepID=UPI003D0CE237